MLAHEEQVVQLCVTVPILQAVLSDIHNYGVVSSYMVSKICYKLAFSLPVLLRLFQKYTSVQCHMMRKWWDPKVVRIKLFGHVLHD